MILIDEVSAVDLLEIEGHFGNGFTWEANGTSDRAKVKFGYIRLLGCVFRHPFLVPDPDGPVGISILIAMPVAYFMMQDWLRDFPYNVGFQPLLFIAAALLAIIIAIMPVGWSTNQGFGSERIPIESSALLTKPTVALKNQAN